MALCKIRRATPVNLDHLGGKFLIDDHILRDSIEFLMGRVFLFELGNVGNKGYYCCRGCKTADGSKTYIALEENIISKNFHGLNWKIAYIFTTIVNEVTGYPEHKDTDGYIMEEVYCVKCLTRLGWKYVSAPDNWIYAIKIGKFLMER
ncbi:hypothetical protein HHK36_019016 [Tetracentron sinense]|uniref:Protein yippee-like n=1 Tax=Tetracentron sinense TaxID=13715 RepID=A0A834Z0H6_TETSI|nr:hypothetical protein HHK36_019016 [Tetracentron sinense]